MRTPNALQRGLEITFFSISLAFLDQFERSWCRFYGFLGQGTHLLAVERRRINYLLDRGRMSPFWKQCEGQNHVFSQYFRHLDQFDLFCCRFYGLLGQGTHILAVESFRMTYLVDRGHINSF